MVQPVLRLVLASLCLVLLASTTVSGRYLPTRSNEDSLDKLRDLLRDVSVGSAVIMSAGLIL